MTSALEDVNSTSQFNLSGYFILENFITDDEEQSLLGENGIDSLSHEWYIGKPPRGNGYGLCFSIKEHEIIPEELRWLIFKMHPYFTQEDIELGIEDLFRQELNIWDYEPGCGISAHTDPAHCFGEGIYIVSTGSSAVMEMRSREDPSQYKYLFLPRKSLLVIQGTARHIPWTHSIPARLADLVDGKLIPRTRRVSFSLRCLRI